ncbi:MAG: hypothetical protein ACI9FJ_002486 [Alteromonadaceae bacterium]|jgi:hypothetical protein
MSINKLLTPGERQAQLAAQFKQARLDLSHSRAKAAKLSGVPVATIRGFETKAQISLRQFLMLCHVYGDIGATEPLFPPKSAQTMAQLLAEQDKPKRLRGRS